LSERPLTVGLGVQVRTTQRKGDRAVATAIASFTSRGWDVSIPLTESAAYDLVVDRDGVLFGSRASTSRFVR
jgi:hypothetical protein